MDVISNTTEPLSGDELALWHACKTLGTVVTQRVGAALTAATGLSGTDYGVISRLADLGAGAWVSRPSPTPWA